ncbi:MAG: S-adenosylmethionine:tRNA ribosyltransferase-isomerase, partial [Xanthomonadales bacterium]|nr:S-adenosylmethionine:tRNA ribosyltransferase-isomerase [Xanthomonadales bacterium]
MKKSEFYFELPQKLIAQHPTKERTQSRLLVLDKDSGAVQD